MKRSTLAALLVLAALGGYIFWFEREPRSASDLERLFDVEEESIVRIEIQGQDREEVVVEKEDGGWRLVSPVAAEADPTEVDLLTQNLSTMEFERAVAKASEVELSAFGLETPKIEVRFRTGDGAERSLAFGADTPTPGNQYLRRDEGEEILVVPSHLSLNFDKSGWDLREKSIFDLDSDAEPRRIEIDRPAGRLVLEKESGLWFVTEPLRARADPYRATSLASRLRTAEMREIVSEAPEGLAAYGLEEPERSIRIELEGAEGEEGPVVELQIGSKQEIDFHARTPSRPQVFLLEGTLAEELDDPIEEFQSKKLFDFGAFEVSRFRIEERGKAERVFEKLEEEGETRWKQTAPAPEREVETSAVEDLLYALTGASASAIRENPSPRELGLEEPALTITVWSKDPPVEERAAVGKPGGDAVYARREGEEVALELTPETWSEIESKLSLEQGDGN